MNFCSACGFEVSRQIPDGDNRMRHVCDKCGVIHYINPKIIAGSLPIWEDKVLLCKRAIDPRAGLWTLPAGFMELGETTQEAAARETLEEACARVDIGPLHCYANIARISQVYVIFRAQLTDLDFAAGPESLEVGLYRESEIPWADIAFPAIERALRLYFDDVRASVSRTHVIDVYHRAGEPTVIVDAESTHRRD